MSRTYPEPISERQQTPADALGTQLLAEFSDAKAVRRYVEDRWMKSLRQYKGQYDPDVLGRIPKDANGRFLKSTVYIRHTKAKVDTLRARLLDLLFPSNNARNWGISPSPVSEIQPDIITEELQRRRQEGRAIPQDEREFLSEIAKERADRMAQTIDDQLNGQIGMLSLPACVQRGHQFRHHLRHGRPQRAARPSTGSRSSMPGLKTGTCCCSLHKTIPMRRTMNMCPCMCSTPIRRPATPGKCCTSGRPIFSPEGN